MDFAKLGFSGEIEHKQNIAKGATSCWKKNKLLVHHGTVPHKASGTITLCPIWAGTSMEKK
jgi:hypothetical protein